MNVSVDTREAQHERPRAPVIRGPVRYLLALAPLWYWLVVELARPGTMEPVGQNPPGVLGLAFGLVVVAVAAVLMVLGLAAVRSPTSVRRVLSALVLLTVPSLLLVALAPVIVLGMQNLG